MTVSSEDSTSTIIRRKKMIHGYMPRGNVDEDLYVPKGQQVIQGYAIGILCPGNVWMPLPPGCPQNAFDLPVFDFYTPINWIYTSVVRRPFAGFY